MYDINTYTLIFMLRARAYVYTTVMSYTLIILFYLRYCITNGATETDQLICCDEQTIPQARERNSLQTITHFPPPFQISEEMIYCHPVKKPRL